MPHELARIHACTHDNCHCSGFASIPSCGGCCSYSSAIPHLFIPSICFCHTLHMMVAATSVWLREGTALLLPLLAYRNVNLVGSMSCSLPCAIASAIWATPTLVQTPSAMVRAQGSDFRLRWLYHMLTFTLAQHAPMFVGCYYFAHVIAKADDTALQLPPTYWAKQGAVAGVGVR
jgi:hypothetical protein